MKRSDDPGGATVSVFRISAATVAGGALLLVGLATVELPLLSGHPFLAGTVALGNLTAAVGCGFALVVIGRASTEPAARALSVLFPATALLYLLTIVPLALTGRAAGDFLMTGEPAVRGFWAGVGVLVSLAGGALLRFAAFFPDPVTEEELAVVQARREEGAEELPGLLRTISRLGWKIRRQDRRLPDFLRLTADPTAAQFRFVRFFLDLARSRALWPLALCLGLAPLLTPWALLPLVFVVTVSSFSSATAFISASYMTSDASGRRKILWFTAGAFPCLWLLSVGGGMAVAGGVGLFFGNPPPPGLLALFLGIVSPAGLVLMAALAAAVFLHGALDPALTIRRTALYGSLGVVVAFLFAVLENALSDWILEGVGLPAGAGAWVAGGIVALTVVPLHRWTRNGVDRLVDERIPDTEAPRFQGRDVVIVRVNRPAPSRTGAPGGPWEPAEMVVLETAARKAANRHGGDAVVRKDHDCVLTLFENSPGVLAAVVGLLRNVRAAFQALELPTTDLRATVHRGPVTVDGRRVFGAGLEAVRELGERAPARSVLVTDAVFGGPPPEEELEGLRMRELPPVRPPDVEEPARLWQVSEVPEP